MTRILIVDHVAEAAESLSLLFVALGHETRLAFDVFAAIESARIFAPRIVFVDLAMPGLDARHTARALSANQTDAAPTLIAVTTAEGMRVNADAKAAGFHAYMKKPLDTMTLIAVVTEIAARR